MGLLLLVGGGVQASLPRVPDAVNSDSHASLLSCGTGLPAVGRAPLMLCPLFSRP